MVRAAWTPAKKIRERNLGLPEVVTEIIDGACEFEQADRYQTASEMRAALDAALSILSNDPDAAEPVIRVPKRTVRGPSLPRPCRSRRRGAIRSTRRLARRRRNRRRERR